MRATPSGHDVSTHRSRAIHHPSRGASVTVPDPRTELYKTIVETSHDAVVVIDHDCRVRLWNCSAESLFGFSEVEMMGCNIHDHITPQRYREMAKRAFTAYQQQRRGGNAIGNVVEIEGLRKDGPRSASRCSSRRSNRWVSSGPCDHSRHRGQTPPGATGKRTW